jgi:hypothetical protein
LGAYVNVKTYTQQLTTDARSSSTRVNVVPLALNPGASEEAIRVVADWIGSQLPFDYKQFLRNSNGGEGFVGQNYLQLWQAEELRERNNGYQVAVCAGPAPDRQ